jgi:hypothetical protein
MKSASAKIVGVYPIPNADDPCHFVEIAIDNCPGIFDLSTITQPQDGIDQDYWQVPWDEHLITSDGESVVAGSFEAEDRPELWVGSIRIGFFFHLLDLAIPLVTPFGDLMIPAPSEFPDRLNAIEYEAP